MALAQTPKRSPIGQSTAVSTERQGGQLVVRLDGQWRSREALGRGDELVRAVGASPKPHQVTVEGAGIGEWDSALVSCLMRLHAACREAGIPLELAGVPTGAVRLVKLATAVPQRTSAGAAPASVPMLAKIGGAAKRWSQTWSDSVRFLGEVLLALAAFVRGKASFRREDLVETLHETGVQALPIVGIITLLIGLILAFIGAVQLSQFGASIYVADLVGLAMTREMAAVMTAIVMSGRTGAAFAAQLGTMQGNEEIDALKTLGISPAEFLVLPRMLALALMMPILYAYGCFIGLFGGYLVGTSMLHLSAEAYVDRTLAAVHLTDFAIGFVKSVVFGLVVAFAGCQRGMGAGRSAAAVGTATTSAVVDSIIYIIVIDAVFAVLLNVLKI